MSLPSHNHPTAQSADQAKKSTSRVADDATVGVTDNVQDIRRQAAPLIDFATEQASALDRSRRIKEKIGERLASLFGSEL